VTHLHTTTHVLTALLSLATLSCAGRSAPPPAVITPPGVTFRVTVPAATPAGDTIFVAGDFQGWNPGSPGHALARGADGRWSITLPLAAGEPIEFKFTRGGWDRVEKGPAGEELANRALTPAANTAYDFTVASWAAPGPPPASTVTGHVESFTHAPFLDGRRVWVYLPPGYAEVSRRYGVLYMHDGQNLFDARTSFAGEWQVDEACERLIAAGEIDPILVVGIENGGARRVHEYTPWPQPPLGGGGAGAYLDAIRDVLVPEIDRRYRTRADREHRWLAGSSLGGLVSAYAGYTHGATFAGVGCVSPSYTCASGRLRSFAAEHERPGVARWYHDMGTLEHGTTRDRDANGLDDMIDALRAMRLMLVAQGLKPDVDLLTVEGEGHRHHESSWARRVPAMLRFLVGRTAEAGR
jgi:predicted alpha/beta superfamily hydrolase